MPRRGENIYKRKDGRWEGRFKPNGSSQKYKSVYAPTYKQAREKLIELKLKGSSENYKQILLCELCEEWLELKKEDIKESTYIKYRNIILNHINPHIGAAYLSRLRNEDMEKFILSLKNRGLSNKSIRDILSVVSAIFKYAAKNGLNTNNLYIENLDPKTKKRQIKILSTDERIRLEQRIIKSQNPAEYGILLALYSGMRIGEICALKWDNIDLNAGTISVCQTLQRLQDKESKGKTKILISEPKAKAPKELFRFPLF